MGRPTAALAAALVLTATAAPAREAPEPCRRYASKPKRVGRAPAALGELSGLAASRRHPGVYWAHNDSGNGFELFAMREDGTLVAQVPLTGGTNVDAEDLAVGPCQRARAESCIYLGDVGDNLERREELVVYEVVEPQTLTERPLAARALPFRYADRPHNAEALLVDPDDARLYLVTKEIDSLGALYRIDDLGPGRVGRAVRLHGLSAPAGFDGLTTGGAVHPSGTRVLVRTYTQVWEYRGRPEQSLGAILATTPVAVPDATQPQGEAVTYTPDGRGYLLASELAAPIYRVDCAD
ncbi:MAG TPA: hypothetical protein VNO26_05720 [Candidatus Limnocylindria bacterium]|nr:hypothetical protein [Candidatus Limnocylindria bacterium]